jgi:hypothetical protein
MTQISALGVYYGTSYLKRDGKIRNQAREMEVMVRGEPGI